MPRKPWTRRRRRPRAKRADKQAKKPRRRLRRRGSRSWELQQLQRDAPGSPEAVQGGGAAGGRKQASGWKLEANNTPPLESSNPMLMTMTDPCFEL